MGLIRKFVRLNRDCSLALGSGNPRYEPQRSYQRDLLDWIHASIEEVGAKRILEAGGIDRPLLSRSANYRYIGLDIEERERCFEVYDEFVVRSIEESLPEKYDLLISITLLEHVPNNLAAFKSIFDSLVPGGKTLHYVPSKWHPYSVSLRILGPKLQERLIPILRSGSEDITGYPAFFDYCSISEMKKLMADQGFTDIRVIPYYRANDYFAFFVPLYWLVSMFENFCEKFDLEALASGYVICGTKPGSAAE